MKDSLDVVFLEIRKELFFKKLKKVICKDWGVCTSPKVCIVNYRYFHYLKTRLNFLVSFWTISSYYIYPLKKTSLDLILDKKFLLNTISKSESYYSDKNIVAFKFFKDENEINLFFDKKTLNLKGWQTVDLYQNLNIVFLSSILINQKIETKKFELPSSD